MESIYLAGFDVFRADAVERGAELKRLCARYGFEGLYPLDNALPAGLAGSAAAHWIYEQNIALIRDADLVLANLNLFRGYEPDSGTAFEVGFAIALDKPVWAYIDDARPIVDHVPHRRDAHGIAIDSSGFTVEDFGLPRNLMLARSAHLVVGDAEHCLRTLHASRSEAPRE
ncbi:nucleoside 2-deoxyribosyltransferase [Pararobbsia silviterrae]|uniref:Nucleoside 2-deoxyribosyltransferase n=1 Tax=Pararobbsia silviterrae TaxID=1792498 RepID=A0A494Y734_9BURK|nr:nucleoside 2-deoxyribosyltransferase [Pararobbsia silviterrae]RKP58529.1 nucleoside 2-deoxyribosyltransferase [Pararobbsia silviterrae]